MQVDQRERVTRIDLDRSSQQCLCPDEVLTTASTNEWHRAQYAVIGLQVLWWLPLHALDLCPEEIWLYCRDHPGGDLFLQIEHVHQCAVEPIGPDVRTSGSVNQLARNPQALSGFANAEFRAITNSERTRARAVVISSTMPSAK